MEWVETTGKTVEAALDAALDELGVDEEDMEFEVLQEARGGLLGRREARVRARVKPLSREKPANRRGGRSRGRSEGDKGSGAKPSGSANGSNGSSRGGRRGSGGRSGAPTAKAGGAEGDSAPSPTPSGPGARNSGGRSSRGRGNSGRGQGSAAKPREVKVEVTETEMPVEEQARIAEEFLAGLVEAFGADAEVECTIDDDTVTLDVEGPQVGTLVGPKAVTLQAIEELVRTVVHRRAEGRGARINVDVGGYRARRREQLRQFALDLAEKVRTSGRTQELEPMSASDRKVVHDAVAELEGVATTSEGEEPRRRVVVRRA